MMFFALLAAAFLDGSSPQTAVQTPGRDAVEQARALWQMRRTQSAIELLQTVAGDPKSDRRPDALLLLGDIYFFRGWESENAFPGWHEEPEWRAQAVDAFRTAEAAMPDWSAPHERLGRILLREERASDALAEFDEALKRAPGNPPALVGRWRALVALGRSDAVASEISTAANASDPEVLGAARQGFLLLSRRDEADAIATRLLDRLPRSAAAAGTLAERIQTARAAKRYGEVLELASRYIQQYPSNPSLVDVYDAVLDAYQANAQAAPAESREIVAAIDARTKLRGDPAPMLAAANLLIARNTRLDKAILLAEESIPAAERFIQENAGAYKMADKARATLARTRAGANDLIGWAYFLEGNLGRAEPKLLEAERLSRGQDAGNQFHLGELARTQGDLDAAREHYLSGELARRRNARHADLVRSLVDRPAPPLKLTDTTGRTIDLAAFRGKVVLLNFFSSW